MGESENISKIAAKISTEIFVPFGWKTFGGVNYNFDCVDPDRHKKKTTGSTPAARAKTPKHPCDVLFGYLDPYSSRQAYFLTDLKSYKKETLDDKAKLRSAVAGLAKSVSCAWKSPAFQSVFIEGHWDIHALLYIFNHDGRFDRDFLSHLYDTCKSELGLPRRSQLFAIGPEDIQFHYDVLNDLEREIGRAQINGALSFFYPNLIERIPLRNFYESATIDILKGRFFTIKFTDTKLKQKAYMYYRGSGATHSEFEYLLDYCFRYSLVDDETELQFRLPYPDDRFMQNFATARNNFVQHFYQSDGAFEKIQKMSVERVTQTNIIFSEYELGMEARREFANG